MTSYVRLMLSYRHLVVFFMLMCCRSTSGLQVWIRGRVHQVRGKGGSAFLVVRQDTVSTVQAVHFKDKANAEDSKK